MPDERLNDHFPDLAFAPMTPGEPATARPAGGRWLPWTLAGILGAVLAMVIGYPWLHRGEPSPVFVNVQGICDAGGRGISLGDNHRTLMVNGRGPEEDTGATAGEVACILDALETPDAVKAHILQTRRGDGRQTDHWDGYTASWSSDVYRGLDLVVEQT